MTVTKRGSVYVLISGEIVGERRQTVRQDQSGSTSLALKVKDGVYVLISGERGVEVVGRGECGC
jgi:RNase P/RNase MRP subunit p29